MMTRRHFIFLITIPAILIIGLVSIKRNDAKPFHSKFEKLFLGDPTRSPIDSGEFFLGSGRCKGCHGYDTLQVANIDAQGVDINLYDDWQTTMMANSAKDPLWRAKVSHEILINAGHSTQLQTNCTSCHAPLGHFTAIFKGAASYTIDELINDTLGLDGVSCGGCHEIGTENLGTVFSGNVPYDTSKKEFGPFLNPLAGPMQLYVGLTPTFSEHMSKSQVCSSCHTLITNTVDLNGDYTGNTFIEQATYHEWLNSALAADNITCQHCHMPQVTDSVIIANNILALEPRSPFNQHQFAGGNIFMVNLIKQNKSSLGISSPDINFDSTLAATYRLLQQKTVALTALLDSISMDTVFLRVRIVNKAGHKFPSGYPSRRAILQLVVLDQNQDTVFQSGTFDSNFEVNHIDPSYERHYNVINQSSQVQLYEMVMGDVNNNVTTILQRADHMMKDNRIPPEGFTSTFPDYDTVKIVGDALNDDDFNKSDGIEGTGTDYVYYHIPVSGFTGTLNVYARIYYQAVAPRYVDDLFMYSSAAIDSFKNMYYTADRNPVLIASSQLVTPVISAVVNPSGDQQLILLNTLNHTGSVDIVNKGRLMIYSVKIFEAGGKLRADIPVHENLPLIPVDLPGGYGIYFMQVNTNFGNFVFKTIRL